MEAQDDGEANDEARAPQPNTNRVPPTPIVEDYATDEEGEAGADEDITSSEVPTDPPTIMQGPMTQARKRQLNLEVSSFLAILFILLRIDYYLMMLSCLGTLERVMKDLEDMVEAKMTSKGTSNRNRMPGPT